MTGPRAMPGQGTRRRTCALLVAAGLATTLIHGPSVLTFSMANVPLPLPGEMQAPEDKSRATEREYTKDEIAAMNAPAKTVMTHVTNPVVPNSEMVEDFLSEKQRRLVPTAEHIPYAIAEVPTCRYGYLPHNDEQMIQQIMVREGAIYESQFLRAMPGAKVRFNRVVLLKEKDQDTGQFQVTIGQPFIKGAHIQVTILEHFRSENIRRWRFRPKKRIMKRIARQHKITRWRVDKIVFDESKPEIVGVPGYTAAERDSIPQWQSEEMEMI